MIRAHRSSPVRALPALLAAASLWACADGTVTRPFVPSEFGVSAAKAAGGVSVTAAQPPYGYRGESQKQVQITGSGFAPGAVASWQRNGVDDPKIQVTSTQYISSTELLATINIAADAALDFYAVAVVNPDRKGGIGTEAFEVTQAIPIQGTEIVYGATDNGELTGRVGASGVFYYSDATGLDTLGSPGRGFDISADGLTIVGSTTVNASSDRGYVYVKTGGTWVRTDLPKDPNATMIRPLALASDPTTGAATIAAGFESGSGSPTNLNRRPRLWTYGAGVWSRVVLPNAGTDDLAFDVGASGVAVGRSNNRAASWDPAGGSWSLNLFGADGSTASGVNSAGTLAVGGVTISRGKTAAAYWTRTGSTWSAPVTLPGGCAMAQAVDELGRIVLKSCPNGSHSSPGVIVPPYGAADITFLGGLGDPKTMANVENISLQGRRIVGAATSKNVTYGVMWQIF